MFLGFGNQGRFGVKNLAVAAIVVSLVSSTGFAQSKGEDKGTQRVRDGGVSAPAANGSKQDSGTGRGIDWGGKAAKITPLENPYRLAGRRDVIMKAVEEVMQDRKLILDETASKPAEGIMVT